MRGLIMQRAYLLRRGQKLGPAYIIFGSRSSKEGLFTDEIDMFHQLGALTEVHHCYSREPGKKKMYATTKLRSVVFLEPFLACEYINQYFKSAHSYIMHFIFFLISFIDNTLLLFKWKTPTSSFVDQQTWQRNARPSWRSIPQKKALMPLPKMEGSIVTCLELWHQRASYVSNSWSTGVSNYMVGCRGGKSGGGIVLWRIRMK